jgi:hypothetical protein
VLYKVSPTGSFDATFATTDAWSADGVFHDMVVTPPLRAEAYGAALQGSSLVTMGYGPTPNPAGQGTDFLALRFDENGNFDETFGTGGVTYVDGGGYGDNGRAVVVLPGGEILGIGGGRRTPEVAPAQGANPPTDGMLALLTPDGLPMASFGEQGRRLLELGGDNDFLWAGALSPDATRLVVVGLKGSSAERGNTDGAVIILPARTGS